jgi:hypothetical protein
VVATTTSVTGNSVTSSAAGFAQTATSTGVAAATTTGKNVGGKVAVNGGLVLGFAGLVGAFL